MYGLLGLLRFTACGVCRYCAWTSHKMGSGYFFYVMPPGFVGFASFFAGSVSKISFSSSMLFMP